MKPFLQSIVVTPAEPGGPRNGAQAIVEPSNLTHFATHVTVFVGAEGHPFSDRFDLIVCSPSWFAEQAADVGWNDLQDDAVASKNVVTGRGFWFMRSWDRAELDKAIESVIARAHGTADWTTAALRINKEIPWEHDYQHRC